MPTESLSTQLPAKSRGFPCRKEAAVGKKAVGEGEVLPERPKPGWGCPGGVGDVLGARNSPKQLYCLVSDTKRS